MLILSARGVCCAIVIVMTTITHYCCVVHFYCFVVACFVTRVIVLASVAESLVVASNASAPAPACVVTDSVSGSSAGSSAGGPGPGVGRVGVGGGKPHSQLRPHRRLVIMTTAAAAAAAATELKYLVVGQPTLSFTEFHRKPLVVEAASALYMQRARLKARMLRATPIAAFALRTN
jgi:hypothetical protein